MSSVPPPQVEIKESASSLVPVMDYEGSGYRQEFWEDVDRSYEDAIERVILRQMMPAKGGRLVELGAGFGRLADLYEGYEEIFLFDYSRTLLADAVARWGGDARFKFVAGNIYQLPFAPHIFDTLVMVRVMHHLADVELALSQIARTLHQESTAILEYANKRNLKSVLRWLSGRQMWNPFSSSPVEFVPLNYDFHPEWMSQQMSQAGLEAQSRLGASHFRVPFLKRRFQAESLVAVERPILSLSGRFPLSPSIFVSTKLSSARSDGESVPTGQSIEILFCCPDCGASPLERSSEDLLTCTECDFEVIKSGQIWDFKSNSNQDSSRGL